MAKLSIQPMGQAWRWPVESTRITDSRRTNMLLIYRVIWRAVRTGTEAVIDQPSKTESNFSKTAFRVAVFLSCMAWIA